MEDFQSKYSGEQVEAILDTVANGEAGGGGGGITVETDPVFSASPAASITEAKKTEWDAKYSKPSGGIPKSDLASAVQTSLGKADTALQSYTEQYKGTVTGVTFYGKDYTPDSYGNVYMGYPDVGAVKEITINGSTKTPANGVVDLGTVLTQHQDISQKADLSNGKILASQLPDYILGQVMYGGVINSGDANNIVVQPSVNYKTKYPLEGSTVTVNKYQFWSQQGVYFISGANGTFFDIEVKVGDWLISTGSSVAKVDNTDAVSSVAGLTGVIDASALGNELSYNDLKDKPTIPAAVTESTVSGWGFTKNTGTYSKPSGGIPASDLASDVFLQGEKGEKGDKGDKGDTGAAGTNGKDGADGATFTPSVDANGNLSWTNNKGLTNPPTVNIKGPKGDSGEGGGTSSDGRKEVIYVDMESSITSMRPNVIYWIIGFIDVSIESFEEPVYGVDTYDVFTAIIELGYTGENTVSLTLPDYVVWANGVIPEIINGCYELSISRISDGDYTHYFAVLTPFRYIR